MNILLRDHRTRDAEVVDHDELIAENDHDPRLIRAVARLRATHETQIIGAGVSISLPPIHTDSQNETTTLAPVTLDTPRGAVTELEISALKAVDTAELITDPVNRYNVARVAVKLSAHIARAIRATRKG
tara:strand:+ start:2532 stop:2918 length:387 start_codon:yes stop_codon:yes gene_type:complete